MKKTFKILILSLLSLMIFSSCKKEDPGFLPIPILQLVSNSSPLLAFTNGQAASVVIGQPDFISKTANNGAVAEKVLASPYGNPLYEFGKLYIPDTFNNRVLGFNSIPTANFASADFVLGQASFIATTAATTASGLSGPTTVTTNGTNVFVTDFTNNRIKIYNSIPTTTNAPADLVIGQTDLTLKTSGCSANQLNGPESSFTSGGKLFIADSTNNRVLIYNSIPSANNAAANVVLGQADFTTCTANRGGAAAANTMSSPTDIWTDGTRLFITDYKNNRILGWNTIPTVNGQDADFVLGQSTMTGVTSGTSASQLYHPYLLTSNGRQLFVADHWNNRVLIWDSIPTASGTPANRVLGQKNFTSRLMLSPPTASSLNSPSGLYVTGNQLIVADGGNNRYLIYNAQ